jgi:hypothetical protein
MSVVAAEDPCAPSAELLQVTESALLSASSPDNAERARAEAVLRPLLRRRGAGAALLALHTGSAHGVVRQLAGVLLALPLVYGGRFRPGARPLAAFTGVASALARAFSPALYSAQFFTSVMV